MDPIIYECTIINLQRKDYRVLDDQGAPYSILRPGESFTIRTTNPLSPYARFKAIEFGKDGKVECKDNSKWQIPEVWKKHPITEFLNNTHFEVQGIYCQGQHLRLFRGIPILCPQFIDSGEWLLVQKAVWEEETKSVPDKIYSHYMTEETQIVCKKTRRPEGECRAINERMKKAVLKEAEKDARRLEQSTTEEHIQ